MAQLSERLERVVEEAGLASAGVLGVDYTPPARWPGARAWTRFAGGSTVATPWPVPADDAVAAVRLHKAREATAMAVAAASGAIRAGAPVYLFGGNDEGIRSVGPLGGLTWVTVDVGGHGRILRAEAAGGAVKRGSELAEWRSVKPLVLPSEALRSDSLRAPALRRADPASGLPADGRPWVSYPGCFAAGGLDRGTALLLETLSGRVWAPRQAICDFGAGTGVIGAAVLAAVPQARVVGVEADAVALVAARENVPGMDLRLGTRLSDAGDRPFDLILSNPPFHQGRVRDGEVWRALILDAPRHLVPGGELRIVIQREVRVEAPLRAAFRTVERVRAVGGFEVWSGR